MESNQGEPLSKLESAHPTHKVIHASILHLRLSSSTSCGRSSTQTSAWATVPSSTWSAPATSVHAARHNANRVCNKTLRTVQNCIYALSLCDHPGSSSLQTYPDRTSPLSAVTAHSRSVGLARPAVGPHHPARGSKLGRIAISCFTQQIVLFRNDTNAV